jgi:hypothetical protein
VSDSFCKGCRDSVAGCEQCLPERLVRARKIQIADAERDVIAAARDWFDSWPELSEPCALDSEEVRLYRAFAHLRLLVGE